MGCFCYFVTTRAGAPANAIEGFLRYKDLMDTYLTSCHFAGNHFVFFVFDTVTKIFFSEEISICNDQVNTVCLADSGFSLGGHQTSFAWIPFRGLLLLGLPSTDGGDCYQQIFNCRLQKKRYRQLNLRVEMKKVIDNKLSSSK